MIKITLDVTTNGEKKQVVVGPTSQVAFEREHDTAIVTIATEQKISHVYWLAWHASKSDLDFDAWLETVDEIDVEVELPGPTPAAPSAA